AKHDRGKIGLGDQPAAERLHQNAGLDRAAAEPAMLFGNRQRQPAEIGKFLPDRRREAERFGSRLAAMLGIVGLADESVGALAQQPLLVAGGEIHLTVSLS